MKVSRWRKTLPWCVAAVVTLVGTSPAFGIDDGFYDLGVDNLPMDVSSDGELVGGEAGTNNAFLWTQAGMEMIGGDFRGIDWYADDGHYSGVLTNTVIMAGRDTAVDDHARVWFGKTDGTGSGWFRLPMEGGANAFLANSLGVAPDNSNYWVAGYRKSPSQLAVRYKHSSLSTTAFGSPPGGGDLAQFDGASNTGVFAGRQRDSAHGGKRRGRYVSSWLDSDFAGEGEANNISPDGTVAVGWDGSEPVWWGTLPGMTTRHAIPLLDGDVYGEATSANEDGSIIVGWSWDTVTRQNWIWDANNGTREIGEFLASEGITVPAGFNFDASGNRVIMISGGSYDNLTIVGNGDRETSRGYVLHISETLLADLTNNGFVDFQDLTILLANWNKEVTAAEGNLVDPTNTPVNFADLTVLLADWTGPGPAASPEAALGEAVPEPSTFLLALLATLGLSFYRRRRRT